MDKAIQLLICHNHENTLAEFSESNILEVDTYSAVLVVGALGVGKSTLIKEYGFKRFNEVHSLTEISNLRNYDFIILFRNTNYKDIQLCADFDDLSNKSNFEYLVIKQEK